MSVITKCLEVWCTTQPSACRARWSSTRAENIVTFELTVQITFFGTVGLLCQRNAGRPGPAVIRWAFLWYGSLRKALLLVRAFFNSARASFALCCWAQCNHAIWLSWCHMSDKLSLVVVFENRHKVTKYWKIIRGISSQRTQHFSANDLSKMLSWTLSYPRNKG